MRKGKYYFKFGGFFLINNTTLYCMSIFDKIKIQRKNPTVDIETDVKHTHYPSEHIIVMQE